MTGVVGAFESGIRAESGTEGSTSAGGNLDDVAHARARQQDAARWHAAGLDRYVATVEKNHVDRESHAERMYRPASQEEQTFVRGKPVAPQEPSPSLATRLGHEQGQPFELCVRAHRRTLAASTDAGSDHHTTFSRGWLRLRVAGHRDAGHVGRRQRACGSRRQGRMPPALPRVSQPRRRWAGRDSNPRHEG
jgi:hypothetical protein